MRRYETPNISVERYDVVNRIMEGPTEYPDGDVGTLPWGDLFTDPDSSNAVANSVD